jgi:ribonuclease HII
MAIVVGKQAKQYLHANYSGRSLEAGLDEAGRGPLAGPVVAAAVILPEGYHNPAIRDSKQLNAHHRAALCETIQAEATAWGIGLVTPEEIDRVNILEASIVAMHRAVAELALRPSHLLVDGRSFHGYQDIPHSCIIRGDSQYLHIAAASILAKTHRDALMASLHEHYPYYGWDRNKGYPTAQHRQALRSFGPSPHHRRSFKSVAAVESTAQQLRSSSARS